MTSAPRYLDLNFAHERRPEHAAAPQQSGRGAADARRRSADAGGDRLPNLEHGRQLRLRVDLEILRDTPGLAIGCIIANADGPGCSIRLPDLTNTAGGSELAAGERVRVRADTENCGPGRYFVGCGLNRARRPTTTC